MIGFLNKMRKTGYKGFTLVELMIVVAIIGILAAIAVPQFMSYMMRSRNATAKAIVHNLKADEANLYSELGVYGHTEVAAAMLIAAPALVGAPADSSVVAALKVAATAGVAGARLAGSNFAGTRLLAIPISIGSNMIAYAWDINNASDDSTFHIFARHFKGDTAYAIDNDVENILLSVSNPTWPNTVTLMATPIAPVLPAADDINTKAGGGLPTVNWTPVP